MIASEMVTGGIVEVVEVVDVAGGSVVEVVDTVADTAVLVVTASAGGVEGSEDVEHAAIARAITLMTPRLTDPICISEG